MAISVRMDPLLDQALTLASKRLGITKSQYIIDAVERALGRKNPFELMQRLQAEEAQAGYAMSQAFQAVQVVQAAEGSEQPYDSDASRQQLLDHLKGKHGAGRPG